MTFQIDDKYAQNMFKSGGAGCSSIANEAYFEINRLQKQIDQQAKEHKEASDKKDETVSFIFIYHVCSNLHRFASCKRN